MLAMRQYSRVTYSNFTLPFPLPRYQSLVLVCLYPCCRQPNWRVRLMCYSQVTEVSQRNSAGSSQANGTSSSPSSGVSSQVTSSNSSTAAATSVKAALAAIQAGQLSLNQVLLAAVLILRTSGYGLSDRVRYQQIQKCFHPYCVQTISVYTQSSM